MLYRSTIGGILALVMFCILNVSCFYFYSDDFNIKVLQAFVELHEFADLNLVQALRWVTFVHATFQRQGVSGF